MERGTFDRLSRVVGAARSRRDAVRLIATAALLGSVATIESATAKGRRKRRKSGLARLQAQQAVDCRDVPLICRTTGNTGCSQPQGNCANKKIGPGTNLTNCNFVNESGDIFQTNFASANLTGTCWVAATLFNQPSFRGANLTNACFFETDLSFSDFRGANLRGASFCFADLTGVDFRGSNITAAQLASATKVACSTILPNGKPAVPCAADQTCCIDICTDTRTDPENCGTCGAICTPPQTCEGGSCGAG
jgi:hypothetical protein